MSGEREDVRCKKIQKFCWLKELAKPIRTRVKDASKIRLLTKSPIILKGESSLSSRFLTGGCQLGCEQLLESRGFSGKMAL